ncbi:MAG: sel1 repeat family protein, partial [Deltaproteobacteria bacterium]|nr:sel1 repeat family protein [Deltaproteobacteria bacterium]
VELVALAEAPSEGGETPTDTPLGNVCTVEGFVWDGQKCTKESQAKGYRCEPQNVAECQAQCELGNADSCYNLAFLHQTGKVSGTADQAAATTYYAKACEGDNLPACSNLAYRLDWKTESERVIGLLQKSCDGGRMSDCRSLGFELVRGTRLPKDDARGERLLSSACQGKDIFACSDLASHYYENKKQAKLAADLLQKDCEGGNGSACSKLAGWLSRCEDGRPPGVSPNEVKSCEKFPDTNANKATLTFETACRSKYWGACRIAGDRYAAGKGVTADKAKAHELYALGCPYGQGSCEALGRTFEKGEGVTADLQKAYDAYAKGCEGVNKGDCYEAARVAKQLGNDTDYRARLEKGCSKLSRRACDELTKLLVKEKKTDDAKAIYGDICTRLRDKAYCDAYLKLGGELPEGFKAFDARKDRKPDDF